MPTWGWFGKFWESDVRRWQRCMQAAKKQMISEGWWEKAGKFNQVMKRRATRLWNEGKIK